MAGRIAYYGNIVKDGLVLNLDAAKVDSYPGSGTTWRDISGFQNNGTLTNGPTFNSDNYGSILLDGSNDYITTTSIISLSNTFTVNAWVKVTSLSPNSSTRRTIITNDYPYLANRGFFFSASGNNGSDFFISLGNDQKIAVTTTGVIIANTICMLTARVNGTDPIRLYKNGVETSYAVQNDGNVALTYLGPTVFGIRGANDPFAGNMYNIQIYNRALSATEVLQNYNATKGRYGL